MVTSLSDPESQLVADGPNEQPAVDATMQDFANAIRRAAVADQKAIAARCKTIGSVPAGGAARASWEENCRYLRR